MEKYWKSMLIQIISIAVIAVWFWKLSIGWGTFQILEIGLEIRFSIYATMVTFAEIFWLAFSWWREDCMNGGWIQYCFNLVPFHLGGLFLFAREHFFLALADFVLLSGIWIYLEIRDFLREISGKFSRRKIRREEKLRHRFAVILIAVFCALPSVIAYGVYPENPPEAELLAAGTEQLTGEEAERIQVKEDSDPYEEHIDLLLQINQEHWEGMDKDERLELVREFAEFECSILGVPHRTVNANLMSWLVKGRFNSETEALEINMNTFISEKSEVRDCMETVCHEIYHWAQEYVVDHIDWEQTLSNTVFFDEFREWKENGENYLDGEIYGYDAYAAQPLEVSARAYAGTEMSRIDRYIALHGGTE